jgi:hypothetical protein
MDAPPRAAWEPLTPQGVAAFAHARLRRLLLVQFVVAAVVAMVVIWFLRVSWIPTLDRAVTRLPATGEIRGGRLNWAGASPTTLAASRLLSLSVDLDHSGVVRSPAHVQFEFGRTNLTVHSLLGYVVWNYPRGWIIACNRTELEPRWGAWRPPLLACVAVGVVVALFGSWFLLATIYAAPVWLVGFFANRELTLSGSWKLASAALLPGALFLAAAISFYAVGALDLVKLGFAWAGHLALGWVYLAFGLSFVPRVDAGAPARRNPFESRPAGKPDRGAK